MVTFPLRRIPFALGATALLLCALAPLTQAQSPGTPEDALAPLPAEQFTREYAAHLLRRAGFGGTPAEIDALFQRGLVGAVDFLVDYENVPDELPAFEPELKFPQNVETRFRAMEQGLDSVRGKGKPGEDADTEAMREARRALEQGVRRDEGQQLQRLRTWWLERMVLTQRPLEEKMTLFWHGHFCSGQRDVKASYHMFLQHELLRWHAVGNFGAFVKAIARDPAMLEYLDCRVNRAEHPNENFARELMELFTLGVGNYTEEDIKEAARAFTGWTFEGNTFLIRPSWHDWGKKTVLGKTGRLNGDDVIDHLLTQEVCARYIVRKIFRFFAHGDPSPEVINGLAHTLRASNYELKPLLRQLFQSREFYSERAVSQQVKSPIVLVASLLRTMAVTEFPKRGAQAMLAAAGGLGQILFEPPNVKGWPDGKDWITTSTLLGRYNLAAALVSSPQELSDLAQSLAKKRGKQGDDDTAMMEDESSQPARKKQKGRALFDVQRAVRGLKTPEEIVDRLCARFLAVKPSAELRDRLVAYLKEGSVDQERLHGLLMLIVSTPEFQLS